MKKKNNPFKKKPQKMTRTQVLQFLESCTTYRRKQHDFRDEPFTLSAHFVDDNPAWTLVHGVANQQEYAWAEFNQNVYDAIQKKIISKKEFYLKYRARSMARYTSEEAFTNRILYHRYSNWR